MSKFVTAALAVALIMIMSSQSSAQAPGPAREALPEAVSKALIDRRLEVLKSTLGLTPDQTKLWPPVEEAIRARLTARHARLASLAARLDKQGEINPIEVMRKRADALAQRAAGLNKLADAWQPLYASLDVNQKQRLAFLATYVLREMRDAVESRLMRSEDEDEDEN